VNHLHKSVHCYLISINIKKHLEKHSHLKYHLIMTTLVALSTKDALVMGCDSLGSFPRPFVDPFQLAAQFFDPKNKWKLKYDKNGQPILKTFEDVIRLSQSIPYNQMTHVDKIFSLKPLEMAVMTTGINSIGNRTIKSIIKEFKSDKKAFRTNPKPSNYTVRSIARKLLQFIMPFYTQVYPEGKIKEHLELLIGGYDKRKTTPTILRIFVHDNKIENTIDDFGIVFAGQMREIQRIVFGTDAHNQTKLSFRIGELYKKYQDFLQDYLKNKGIEEQLPPPQDYIDELRLFHNWELDGFNATWGDFSEQNAIECVNFFVQIMIKSQQFSASMPTVGGNVHIALITKDKGFNFVSKEQYEHEGFVTPKSA